MKSSITELKNSTNKMASSDQEKANMLGEYFSSVFVKEPIWSWNLYESEKPNNRKRLQVKITKENIHKTLSGLNPIKSPGPDNLHPIILKELADVITDPLFMIFTKSLETSKVPTKWKEAKLPPFIRIKVKNTIQRTIDR